MSAENKRRIAYGLAVFILLVGLIAYSRYKSAELSDLTAAYKSNLETLKTLEEKVTFFESALTKKDEEISRLRADNDKKVKEMTVNAYKKARNLNDDELSSAFDGLVSGARRRNAERERAISQ